MKSYCHKKRLSRVDAMLIVAHVQSKRNRKRHETRWYWCKECRAYHTTSQEREEILYDHYGLNRIPPPK